MVKKENYKYPDIDDKASIIWIENEEPFKGYWNKSDKYILAYVEKYFKNRFFDKMIDVGCGRGRLIYQFYKYFNQTVALEPDSNRLGDVTKWIKKHDINNVSTINTSFLKSNLQDNFYDVIICSHVIQHISSNDIAPFFKKMYRIFKKDGLLILFTTHSMKKRNIFLKSVIKNGKVVEPIIEKAEFERIISNDIGILPCCLFSLDYLNNILIDFKILKRKLHHALYKYNFIDKLILRDKLINFPFLKNRFGTDVLYICKKRK